jgi:trimethylamine---corrinoid protein Co-methyltransferase
MEAKTKTRRRPGRKQRTVGKINQRPWKQPQYKFQPMEILSADEIERIHKTGLKILEEIGITVMAPEAREAYVRAGFDLDEATERVRFDADILQSLIAKAPNSFVLHARNAERNIVIGDKHAVFASTGGPAFCMDMDNGRHDGTYAEACDYLRLVQSLDILHQEGGGGFEALDLPAETRHLDLFYSQITLLDKNWQPWGVGREQAMDALDMAAIMMGKSREALVDTPVFVCVVNMNSPLQLDIPMAEGLITMVEHGQAVVVTPFTLAGAMAPVTLAGALAQQHAEAMAGIALAQIIRPGNPVIYGGFTSNVDMKTGSPAFGTPEYAQAAQVSGQLARHLGVPFRSSNVTAANTCDAQAAYESQMSLWGATTGQANLIMHAAGWLGGGLTGSFEKLIIDAEMLQMMAAYNEPLVVDENTLAFEAIREVGPGGHNFGTQHTMDRYEGAFYSPILSNWDNYNTWVDRGQINAEQRANQIWKQLLSEYEQPPLDPAIDEALKNYVEKRKREYAK